MPTPITLDGHSLSIADVVAVARHDAPVAIAPQALASVGASRRAVESAVARGDTIYGVNTGFGKLAHVRIKPDQARELQLNLIRSHASGVGEPLSVDAVRAMMLLRANVLLRGTSGVRAILPELIVGMLNAQVHPRVPSQGSVGASGDLAPLAHLALAMIGEGEGEGEDGPALRAKRLEPITLEAKEGLAFVNGTQAQTGLAALLVHDAWVHEARPHAYQQRSAALLRTLLADSEIRESHRENDPRVQDAYSLRCTPQVLGAVGEALAFAERLVTTELNAATDNPLVFDDDVLSGGNFPGQPLSLARDPGVESGFMIPQIAAAALVAECRVLATPASIQSVPTEGNQEDVVPMGMTSAWKAERIVGNAVRIVAVELLAAAQGLEFLKPLNPGQGVGRTYASVRAVAAALDGDRPFTTDIEQIASGVRAGAFDPEAA